MVHDLRVARLVFHESYAVGENMKRVFACAWLVSATITGQTTAQDRPSAARVISQFTTASQPLARANAYAAVRKLLTQEGGTVSAGVLDSVATGLAKEAVRGNDQARSADAITVLMSSGSARARVPYHGAFARLRDVVRDAKDPGISGAALSAMSGLADRKQSIAYIASFLDGKTQVPPSRELHAIELLSTKFGPEGRLELKRIDEAGTVQDDEARAWLRSLRKSGYPSRQ